MSSAAGRVILYIATSVDGYIADETGRVDWLEEFEETPTDSQTADGFGAFFESVDCLVMGATTYEQVLDFGEWPYGDKPTYVFSRQDRAPATDAVEFVDRNVTAFSNALREEYGRIWLVGGATLARAFLEAQEIDELRLFFVPILLGDGVSLFGGGYDRQRLQLLDTAVHDAGIVEHRYELLGRDRE